MSLSAGGELPRVLPFRDLVLLIIGTVIGSGIFLVPGLLLEAVGASVSLALCGWLLGGVLWLLDALTYGEWSALNPQGGGWYVYIRDCFERFPAFLFGWILFLIVSTGSIATLAVAFSNYLRDIFPVAPWSLKFVSLAMIGIIAAVNIVGTRSAANSVALTGSRIYYTMTRDGVFFRRHSRFGTPAFAVGAMTCCATVLAATNKFEKLLTYIVFVGWAFYAWAAASIVVYRKHNTVHSARYQAPGYPWTPPTATVAGVVINTILAQAVCVAIGIGIVLTGVPASLIWRKG